jgi:hypothetical protein
MFRSSDNPGDTTMKRILRLRRGTPSLESELKALRPRPRADFVHSLASRIDEAGRPARRPHRRLALAGALTAVVLAAMAGVGGFGYAATAARQAAHTVTSLLTSSGSDSAIDVTLNAGGDQYQPGYSWGDPAHNHEGPPGLTRRGGALAPPLVASCNGQTALVRTTIVLDEQAVVRVSVLSPSGKKLLLNQKGSRIGGQVSGQQTKTITYRVLVPRALRVQLRIPCSLLAQGKTYRVVFVATDPDGGSTTLKVPFRALVLTS